MDSNCGEFGWSPSEKYLLRRTFYAYQNKFRDPLSFGLDDAPHTQNFEILKSLEQLSSQKKLKSVLKFL
jgi:hypothetical protein